MNNTTDTKWFSGKLEHEGLPLHLRFPSAVDFDQMASELPYLLTLTHCLAEVASNGEPTSSYNDTLADLDYDLINVLGDDGHTVLVETFAGRRNYYIYVRSEAISELHKEEVSSKYPQHKFEWALSKDSSARFIKGYSEDYDFYQ